ncbi:MAG: hypothetical protein V7655_12520 [Aequorivita antarctica]
MKAFKNSLFTFIALTLISTSVAAQVENNMIGKWQLQKVSFKKTLSGDANNNELLLAVFKAALYEELSAEQRLNVDDLEAMNAEAALLLNKYHQTTIDFQPNGAFYNSAQLAGNSLSGEYLLDKKKLLLEWETGDKNEFKVLKNTTDELIFKDPDLKVSYYYLKTNTP